jgi:hypothetical protein
MMFWGVQIGRGLRVYIGQQMGLRVRGSFISRITSFGTCFDGWMLRDLRLIFHTTPVVTG